MTRRGEEFQVKGLPETPKMGGFTLSRDDEYLAFTQTEPTGISLWVVDMTSFEACQLTEIILNEILGRIMAWTPDNKILIKAVNPTRGEIPEAPAAPAGPIIQETSGNAVPSSTYQDLLANPHVEVLFS